MTRFRLDRSETILVGLTLVLKAALLLGGALVYIWFQTGANNPLAVWNRWDAPHYLDLVVFGYRAVDHGDLIGPNRYRSVYPGDLPLYIVFYPLFVWLSTAVNAALNSPLISVFVVSSVASLFVAPLLYRLVRLDEEPDVAFRAAVFALVFPAAFFLHIGYTESLFLALALGAFLAARTDRWWLAGFLGGLSALTRINGLVLILALGVEAVTQWFEQPPGQRRFRWRWLAIGLVGVGFAGYLALNQVVYGDPFHFLIVQSEHWYKGLAPPWESIGFAFRWFREGSTFTEWFMYGAMELVFVAIGLVGTVYAAFRFRPSWFAWMAGNMVLFTSTAFLVSTPRYSLVLFPLFVMLARLTRGRAALLAVVAVSVAGLVYFAGRFAFNDWAF